MISPKEIRDMAAAYTAAWNSKTPANVASFYARGGEIIINHGELWRGRDRIEEMAAGFYADVPDLALSCDDVRVSDHHAIFVWTFTGHDARTGHPLKISGWEEWDLNDEVQVQTSRGWFDAADYARQVAGE